MVEASINRFAIRRVELYEGEWRPYLGRLRGSLEGLFNLAARVAGARLGTGGWCGGLCR